MNFNKQMIAFAAGLAWAVLSGAPAVADDTELFVGLQNPQARGQPNILLILDDSRSMEAELVTQTSYDPDTPYTGGGCDTGHVYWSTDGQPPLCTTENYFERSGLRCREALRAFDTPGGGTYRDVLASYDSDAERWEELDATDHDREIECAQDWGLHGESSGSAAVYPQNGDPMELWTDGTANRVQWGQNPADELYWLYDGNWLAHYYSPGTESTRMQVVKDVANNLVETIGGVNIGLMHFLQTSSTEAPHGGRIAYAIEDVATARTSLHAEINNLSPTKFTPLSETLYEAALYFMGRSVQFGSQPPAPESVAASRLAGDDLLYASPIEYSCQKNYIVYLTDGEPSGDDDADSYITELSDATGASIKSLVSTIDANNQCDVETYPDSDPSQQRGGECLDELAEFLYEGDLSPLAGKQNVVTHTVGFALQGNDLPILRETAERGGGNYYEAADTASLTTALADIVLEILDNTSSFTSPAVAVNAFNRTQNLNDLYLTVFEPSSTEHWPGNLKKYRLRPSDAAIVDATGAVAVNPATGFFYPTARSLWSQVDDGNAVERGGAANQIPASRNVYTYLGTSDELTNPANLVAAANGAIDDDELNTGDAGQPTRLEVLDFINGIDTADHDKDGNKSEPRFQMGDPLHGTPVTVVYGPTVEDAVIYFATNDGYLHAVNTTDGSERWAFIPQEFLGKQVNFFLDSTTPTKTYGVDGTLRVQQVADHDGIIEQAEGEKVYLFFGMRRGGEAYYALDITNPDAPRVLWKHDGSSLTGNGQSWASATPTRMLVGNGSTQNDDRLVVVIAGGYDPSQDEDEAAIDDSGNSIYIVDSESGAVLWHGSKDGADADFDTEGKSMDYSIPADVKVIDFDGDGYADRMYAADMGGQIWRFDVHNSETAANLITGGVIAQLGSAPEEDPDVADVRRFYYSPDVALVQNAELRFVHIGIGSGHRAHPLGKNNADRYYALRDYNALRRLTQSEYDAITPITDADLAPISAVNTPLETDAQGRPTGWKLVLDAAAGEKVLSEARTFNNKVMFTTFTPSAGPGADPCAPSLGTNRLYMMSIFNGAPVNNLDGSVATGPLTQSDISRVIAGGTILPSPAIIFPSPDPACTGADCNPPPVICVGRACFPEDFNNNPVRTFWTQKNVD
jgi:type IV pilus assembly protein PilY1